MLSNTLRLNFWHLKIIQILQSRYKPRIIGHILKDKQKNKCVCIRDIIRLTHYSPVLLIYTSWKHQKKPLSFLMFSGGIDKQHRTLMDYIFECLCWFLCQDFQVADFCHNFYINHENVKTNQHLFNKAVVKIKQKKM